MKKIFGLFIFILSIQTSTFAASLSGNYTIGSAGDYTSFTDAITDLDVHGISGPVFFNVEVGHYAENVIIPYINGSSDVNKIHFQAASSGKGDVTIESQNTSMTTNYVVQLDSANYITFNGITFKASGTNYARVFHLLNSTHHITWENNFFEAPQNLTKFGDSLAIIYSLLPDKAIHSLSFTSNEFSGGAYGIYSESYTSFSRGYGYLIKNNSFNNQSNGALYVSGLKSLIVRGNSVSSQQGVAFNLNFNDSAIIIANNKIDLSLSSGSTGISMNGHNSKNNQGELLIYNNIIRLNIGTGLSISNVYRSKIIHNTVYTVNTASYNNFSITNSDTNDIKNNLFINNGAHKVMNWDGPHENSSIDHNVYYSSGPILITEQNTIDHSSISSWSSSSSHDQNSLSILPVFKTLNSLEFKCNVSNTIQNGGAGLGSPFDVDYNGNVRQSIPWIGANELHIPSDNPVNISGFIYLGTDTIKSGHIEVYADTSSRKVLDKIGFADINADGSYNLIDIPAVPLYIQIHPNSTMYPDFLISFHDSTLRAEKSIALNPDDCNGLIKDIHPRKLLSITYDGDGVIQGKVTLNSGGTNKTLGTDPIPGLDVVLDKIPPTKSVAKTKTDALGNYTFSGLPLGTYQVSIEYQGLKSDTVYEVEVIGSDTLHEELNYCIDTTSQIEGCYPGSVGKDEIEMFNGAVFPNPFNSKLSIQNLETISKIEMFDITGKQVWNEMFNSNSIELDTKHIKSGFYLLKITSNNKVFTVKVMK